MKLIYADHKDLKYMCLQINYYIFATVYFMLCTMGETFIHMLVTVT